MNYKLIEDICKRGKLAIIPKWIGYLKYNHADNELLFVNGDYVMSNKELYELIKDREDLYYII